jgi:hypothetical protein
VPIAELERLEMFGPGPLAPATRARVGDYVGIAEQTATLYYLPEGETPGGMRGVHSGLSAAEMQIPLIVA